jgi:hypothetical protein
MNTESPTYELKGVDGPWGEYSRVIFHGMASLYRRGLSGELLLERMGPYVPPVTFPSGAAVVVTDGMREALIASDLTGFSFRPVIKKLIVRSRWHEWDLTAPEPKRYPRGGRPENYILTRPHDQDAAEQIGGLWELLPGDDDTADIFRRAGPSAVFVSERARRILEARAVEWLVFEPA